MSLKSQYPLADVSFMMQELKEGLSGPGRNVVWWWRRTLVHFIFMATLITK